MRILSRYYLHRPKMATGDLVEFASNSLIGKLIRCRTGQAVNHTARIIRLTQYDTERVFLLEALEYGIVLNLLSRRLEGMDGSAWWVPLERSADSHRLALGRCSLGYVGIGYDFLSLAKQIAGRVSADARRLFCSEFIAVVDRLAGMDRSTGPAPFPGEFSRLKYYGNPVRIL